MSTRTPVATTFSPFLAALSCLALAPGAAAQVAESDSGLDVGDRVRVESTTHGRLVGTLAQRPDTGLVVRTGSGERFVPDSAIEGVEVSLGRGGGPGKGAAIGAGVGAGLGLATGLANQGDGFLEFSTEEVMLLTVLSGAMGAGVGALVGLATGGEEWAPVGHRPVTLSLSSAAGGTGIGLGLRIGVGGAGTGARTP